MGTYVVAGVTGRVGSVVARELLAQQHRVIGIARVAGRGAAWATGGGEVAHGSLDDAEFLTRTLDGVDGFFALLPEDPFAADFHGARRAMADAMATAVRTSRVPQVVLLSAVAASLADGNGPASDLHYLERALRTTGATLSIIRACWFQENVAAMLTPATAAGIYPNFMASADAPFPTIATRDVGRVAASLLLSPPAASEVIDLAGPLYSSRELATALGSALGKQLQVVDVPAVARAGALMQAGLPQPFAETVAELYACFESGRVRPEGDRALAGATTIHDVLPDLLATLGGRTARR
jgi:uncharacterized protein YbjT (DUF2867 family)